MAIKQNSAEFASQITTGLRSDDSEGNIQVNKSPLSGEITDYLQERKDIEDIYVHGRWKVRIESKLEALEPVILSIVLQAFENAKHIHKMLVYVKYNGYHIKDVEISKTKVGYKVVFTPITPGNYDVELMIDEVTDKLNLLVQPQALRIIGELLLSVPVKHPRSMAVNKTNTKLALTNYTSHNVALFNLEGELIGKLGLDGVRDRSGRMKWETCPSDLAFIDDVHIAVSCVNSDRITIHDTDSGDTIRSFHTDGNWGIGVDPGEDRIIIVKDVCNKRIQVFTSEAKFLYSMELDALEDDVHISGSIFHDKTFIVSDLRNHVLRVFRQKGLTICKERNIGQRGGKDGELWQPHGVTVDKDDNILVCDTGNHRLHKFNKDGDFIGKSDLIEEPSIIVCLNDGRLLVRDEERETIFIIK
ncbi:protein lin-41 [Nematostella vectensis]|uniref:protein lin-41 n=1 Tax=Nematostella vectensis TaxID=45351 RepID=UPI00207727FF|nr:protein lin-41 [Nematostella vectensis]